MSASSTTARSTPASTVGSTYEYTAAANKLHFYIIDKRTDAQGVLRYTVGVRSLGAARARRRAA